LQIILLDGQFEYKAELKNLHELHVLVFSLFSSTFELHEPPQARVKPDDHVIQHGLRMI